MNLITLSRLGSLGLGLVTAPIVARELGPLGRGITSSFAATLSLLALLLELGLGTQVKRIASDPERLNHLVKSRTVLLLISPISFALGYFVTYFLFPEISSQIFILIWIGLSLSVASAKNMIDLQYLVSIGNFRRAALSYSLTPLFNLVFVLVAAGLGELSTTTAIVAIGFCPVLTSAVGSFLTRSNIHQNRAAGKREILRTSRPFLFILFAEALVNRFDQALAFPLLGGYQAGLYSVAAIIGVLPLQVSYSVANAALLKMRSNPIVFSKVDLARIGISIPLLFSPAICVGSTFFIPILFGSDFNAAVFPTWIAVCGGVVASMNLVLSQSLILTKSSTRLNWASTAGIVVGILIMFLLGDIWGANAGAIASLAAYVVMFLILIGGEVFNVRLYRLSFEDLKIALSLLGLRK